MYGKHLSAFPSISYLLLSLSCQQHGVSALLLSTQASKSFGDHHLVAELLNLFRCLSRLLSRVPRLRDTNSCSHLCRLTSSLGFNASNVSILSGTHRSHLSVKAIYTQIAQDCMASGTSTS